MEVVPPTPLEIAGDGSDDGPDAPRPDFEVAGDDMGAPPRRGPGRVRRGVRRRGPLFIVVLVASVAHETNWDAARLGLSALRGMMAASDRIAGFALANYRMIDESDAQSGCLSGPQQRMIEESRCHRRGLPRILGYVIYEIWYAMALDIPLLDAADDSRVLRAVAASGIFLTAVDRWRNHNTVRSTKAVVCRVPPWLATAILGHGADRWNCLHATALGRKNKASLMGCAPPTPRDVRRFLAEARQDDGSRGAQL